MDLKLLQELRLMGLEFLLLLSQILLTLEKLISLHGEGCDLLAAPLNLGQEPFDVLLELLVRKLTLAQLVLQPQELSLLLPESFLIA